MPISMPSSPGFIRVKFGLQTNTQRFQSPINRYVQRVSLAGARWTASYSLPRMNRTQLAPWQAFLAQLDGSYNTFYGYDPDAKTPRGVATGTPLVNGASQTGSTLVTDGWTAGVTNILRAGDYFTVNNELKMVTADVSSNGSGQATISFKPALRSSPADNAPLTVTNATCIMALTDDSQMSWASGNRYGFYDELSFSAIEVFS